MDPIWQLLPRELVYKICNMLTRIRRIPPELKLNIEFQELQLRNFYRSCIPLFSPNPWIYVFNSLSVFISRKNLFPLDQEWDPRSESYYLWYRLTPDQRSEFLQFNDLDE